MKQLDVTRICADSNSEISALCFTMKGVCVVCKKIDDTLYIVGCNDRDEFFELSDEELFCDCVLKCFNSITNVRMIEELIEE